MKIVITIDCDKCRLWLDEGEFNAEEVQRLLSDVHKQVDPTSGDQEINLYDSNGNHCGRIERCIDEDELNPIAITTPPAITGRGK